MNRSGRHVYRSQSLNIWILMLLVSACGTGTRADELPEGLLEDLPEDLPGTLQLATYHATAFSHNETGSLLWLAGPEGILRLEIRRGPPPTGLAAALAPLLEQRGQGWTAILTGQGDDTLNAWEQEWRRPPTGLARAVFLISQELLNPRATAVPLNAPWRARSVANRPARHPIPSLLNEAPENSAKPIFRRGLTYGGLGRGGADDVLEWDWLPAAPPTGSRLRVRITRRPGQLELTHIGAQNVDYAFPEAFVPLWPLSQLVTIAH